MNAGDYISIKEIDFNENQTLVAFLTSTDRGPSSKLDISNWNKKIISSSTNRINIEFNSDDIWKNIGFSANIYFKQFPKKECESWLDMNKKTLKSPNYPLAYSNSLNCTWLITVDQNCHITLDVTEYYVRYQIVFISSVFF